MLGLANTGVLDRPGLDLSQVPVSQRTDAGFGSADTSKNKFTGGGNFRYVAGAACVQASSLNVAFQRPGRASFCGNW